MVVVSAVVAVLMLFRGVRTVLGVGWLVLDGLEIGGMGMGMWEGEGGWW